MVTAGMLVLLFAYILLVIQPVVLYHADGVFPRQGSENLSFPTFLTGTAFFRPFLDRPGGPTEYLAACLSQSFSDRLIGSALLTLIGWLSMLLAGVLLTAVGGDRGGALRVVPLILLAALWGRYTFHLAELLGALLALAVACACVSLKPGRLTTAAFMIASVGLYYLAGGPAMLLAAVCGPFELLHRRRCFVGGLFLLLGGLTPLAVGVWAFGLSAREAYGSLVGPCLWIGVAERILWGAVYGFVVLMIVATALKGRFAEAAGRLLGRSGLISHVVLVAAGSVVVWWTFDSDLATLLRLNYCARTEDWSGVLTQADRYPRDLYTIPVCRDVNRALCETGVMPDKMFNYPQVFTGLMPMPDSNTEPLWLLRWSVKWGGDTLLQLGAVNQAEHLAYESLELRGHRPGTLRLLARAAMIKGQPDAARLFLNALRRDIIHRRWADRTLTRLTKDPTSSFDPVVARTRGREPKVDRIVFGREQLLSFQLSQDSSNRMAYEYLIAHCLLRKRLGRAERYLRGFRQFGYATMPEHWAEALLLAGPKSPDAAWLRSRSVRPETFRRGAFLCGAARANGPQRQALANQAAERLPGSYYVYFLSE